MVAGTFEDSNADAQPIASKKVLYGALSLEAENCIESDPVKLSPEEIAAVRNGMPELTVKAMVLGCILSIVLGAANAYLGLKVGMTVSASIPASVMSMAVLSLFDSHTVLENNMVQTCAASGPSVTAGAIFTIPALLMSGHWTSFGYIPTLSIILIGGVLGILFTIPLRRALIVNGALKFPEGVATATVLETGASAGDKTADMYALGFSSIFGLAAKLGGQGFGLWAEDGCSFAFSFAKGVFFFGTDLSVALVGVGYIVGLNICCLCFAGGFINWWIAIPFEVMLNSSLYEADLEGTNLAAVASGVWSAKTRYLGVGAMTIGGLWALVSLRRELFDGVMMAVEGMRQSHQQTVQSRCDRDLPWNVIFPLLAVCTAGFLYQAFCVTVWYAALSVGLAMLVAAFLFSAVAAYMAGLVGSSNNPISGITISSILVCSIMLCAVLGHHDARAGATAAVVIGSMVCCAAAIGGDNMQDLKCGRLVGATPWKQQVSQLVGVLSGALVIPLVMELLRQAYGFEGAAAGHSHPLPAPQAGLMQAVAQGVFERTLPWGWVSMGALLAIFCIILDRELSSRGFHWRCPVLAVAVGVYLPWSLTVPMMLGGIVAHAAETFQTGETAAHRALLVSSGLITGEALMGIGLAIPVAWTGREDALYLRDAPTSGTMGLGVLCFAAVGLGAVAMKRAESTLN
eukprot:TRINITY_DN14471_c0_g1_i1.p1 TRINITY_DN14471_c0_g1~~TRINITY_DN14471_c0_g1_i1.p1  ORF type:complete len:702 (+),score=93.84 TRINITY_DN14471_c0_g1_i1:51-2108(+)